MLRLALPQEDFADRGPRLEATCGLPAALQLLAALLVAIVFASRAQQGIWYTAFGDESEHLLGAQVLQAGGTLYRTYIDAHGPVIFMLTQLYGTIFGWTHPNWARLIPAVLALCAGLSIVTATTIPNIGARFRAATLFFGLTAAVWLLQALFMVNYYAIAGWFLLIGCAWFVVPTWVGSKIYGPTAFISGVCLVLAALSAYSLMPSIAMLTLSGGWAAVRADQKRQAMVFLAGGLVAALGILLWLLAFGDLRGYLAFHIVANQLAYSKYLGFTVSNFLHSVTPSVKPECLIHSLGLLCCAWSFLVLLGMDLLRHGIRGFEWRRRRGLPRPVQGGSEATKTSQLLPILLGFAGVLLLNARGTPGFQDGTFLVTAIGLATIAAARLTLRFTSPPTPLLLYGWVFATIVISAGADLAVRKYAISSPDGLTHSQILGLPPADLGASNARIYLKVRSIVGPNERMLVLVYFPGFYLAADRLPMDKYYEYLPWDADYAKAPWFGRDHDLCVDLAKSTPPLVYFDNWKVWRTHDPSDYMPCVPNILSRDYERDRDFPKLYIRKDRAIVTE